VEEAYIDQGPSPGFRPATGDLADPKREMEVETRQGIGRALTEHLFDAIESLAERIDVNVKLARRLRQPGLVAKKDIKGSDELGVALAVVGDQRGQRPFGKRQELLGLFTPEEHPIDTEVGESHRFVDPSEALSGVDSPGCLEVRVAYLGYPVELLAHADADLRVGR
jgi:hypothetical protein